MLRHVLRYPSQVVLAGRGPLVDVIFSAHPDLGPTPGHSAAERVTMLIDTGAHRTLVDDRVAKTLGLRPGRFDPITGVDGVTELRPVYRMQMVLVLKDHAGRDYHLTFRRDIVGMKPQSHSLHGYGLIGRDFLAHLRMIYDGHKGQVCLEDDHSAPNPQHVRADEDEKRAKKLVRKAKKDARKKNRH